jgi:hypothetical protein
VLLAVAGVILAIARRADFVRWGLAAWLAAWLAVVFMSLLRWMMLAKGGHGRLLFPAIASVAVILVLGLRGISPKRITDGALALSTGATMAALGVYTLLAVVRPAYARPESIAALPADVVEANAVFGPPDAAVTRGLVLRGVDLPRRVDEGRAPVTLYWQLDTPTDAAPEPVPGGPWDGFVALRLDVPPPPAPWGRTAALAGVQNAGESGPSRLAYLGAGTLPPALMTPGALYADARTLPDLASAGTPNGDTEPPANSQPYLQRLSVHLFHPDTGRWELTSGDVGPAGGDDEWAAWLVRDPERALAAPGRAPDGTFGEEAPLAMWSDVGGESSDRVLNLVWRRGGHEAPATTALLEPEVDLSVFVHFLDESGALVAQADGPPSTAAYFPTWAWQSGDIVATAPVAVPDGAARAMVGLYDPVSGRRVPVTDALGNQADALSVDLVDAP